MNNNAHSVRFARLDRALLRIYFTVTHGSHYISTGNRCCAETVVAPAILLSFYLYHRYRMEDKSDKLTYNDADIERAASCLKAMSHPLRLKILCVLGNESISVQDIVDRVGTSQSNISQHLAILRNKGILGYKKESNRVYYFIDDERVIHLIQMMRSVFCGS